MTSKQNIGVGEKIKLFIEYLGLLIFKWENGGKLRAREWTRYYKIRAELFGKYDK